MTDHQDPKTPANDHADGGEEAAKRAGAEQTSLQPGTNEAEPDIDKDDVSEADLDEALEDSMDGSDPPASIQP